MKTSVQWNAITTKRLWSQPSVKYWYSKNAWGSRCKQCGCCTLTPRFCQKMERKAAIFHRPIFAALQGSYVISLVGTCWRAVCTDGSFNCTFNHKIRAVQLMEREPRNLGPGLAPRLSPSFSYSQGADNCVCMGLIICTCKISVDWVLITATEQKK